MPASLVEQQRLNILRRGGTPQPVMNANGKIIKYVNVSGGNNNGFGGGRRRTRKGRRHGKKRGTRRH